MNTPENPPKNDLSNKFFGGDVDEQAIQDYLNLAKASEIARLAALMAPRPKRFDADALVDQAIELKSAAERGLIRKRESMVASFNYATQLQLLTRLGIPMSQVYSDDNDPKLRDPVSGPPLRFVGTILKRSFELSSAQQAQNLQDGIRSLRERFGPSPQLPCDLVTILRYASHSEKMPDEVLIAAFTDFLGLYQSQTERQDEEEIRNEYAELESLKKQRGALAQPQQEVLDQYAAGLKEIDERQRHREAFTPDGRRHPELDTKGKAIFEKYWSGDRSDFDERNLLWIMEEFSPFLQTHGKTYQALHRKERRRQQALKKARSQAGQRGASSREERRWKRHTAELCAFLRSKELKASEKPRDLLEAFAGTENKLRARKAKSEFLDFFGAIWNSAMREPEDLSVPRELRPRLSIEAIREIRREIKAALKARKEN